MTHALSSTVELTEALRRATREMTQALGALASVPVVLRHPLVEQLKRLEGPVWSSNSQARRMDRVAAVLRSLIPRGWLVLGLVALAPSLVSGRESPAAVAVVLGGVLLGSPALARLTSGLSYLAGAVIAWNQVAPLVRAVSRPEGQIDPESLLECPRFVSERARSLLVITHGRCGARRPSLR